MAGVVRGGTGLGKEGRTWCAHALGGSADPMKSSRTKHAPSAENRDRRAKLLQRLGVNPEEIRAQANIYPLLKQCGILPARVIEVLRADHQVEASQAVVAKWDDLS